MGSSRDNWDDDIFPLHERKYTRYEDNATSYLNRSSRSYALLRRQLEEAIKESKERGKEIVESYKHMDRNQIIVLIAKYIYNHTEGADQGCVWWDELDERQRNHYISVAKFTYNIVMWSQK